MDYTQIIHELTLRALDSMERDDPEHHSFRDATQLAIDYIDIFGEIQSEFTHQGFSPDGSFSSGK